MRFTIAAAAMIAVTSTSVLAADHSSKHWDGVYGGAQVGMAWDASADLQENIPTVTGVALPAPLAGLLSRPLTSSTDLDGAFGGIHIGARKQFGQFTLGIEARVNGSGINGNSGNCLGLNTVTTNLGLPTTSSCETEINWMASGVVKPGFAMGRWHVYGLIGYAMAGVDHRISTNIPLGPANIGLSSGTNDTADGLVFGLGSEFKMSKDWSFGVEWNRYDLESSGSGLLLGGVISSGSRDIEMDTVQARLTMHF